MKPLLHATTSRCTRGLQRALWALCTGMLLLPAASGQSAAPSRTLQGIHDRGEIIVGVKTDLAPFGMLDRRGTPVGFEVDLAALIAARLGVSLHAVGVSTENRFQRLEQGTVDLIIATAADTRERRALATAIEPDYYAGGATIMLPPGSRIAGWAEVRDQSLCAIQSAYFNKPIARKYGATLLIFRNLNDALVALRDQRCIGMLYSDTAILNYLRRPEWVGYGILTPSDLIVPWTISIRRSDHGSDLERQLGDFIADFHRAGILLELEQKWGLPRTSFLSEAHTLWTLKAPDGAFVCTRGADGQWPAQCRNQLFSTSAPVESGTGSDATKNRNTAIGFLLDAYDRGRYLKGFAFSIALTLLPLLLTLPLAAFIFFMLTHGSRPLRLFARISASLCRMTPPLLQMYLVYFAACGYLQTAWGLSVPAFPVAVACLTTYHAAIISFSLEQTLHDIHIRQPAFPVTLHTIPGIMARGSVSIRGALTNLSKATTIASAIAIPELLSVTLSIINDQGNTMLMMNMLLIAFFLSTSFWSAIIRRAERWLISHARMP